MKRIYFGKYVKRNSVMHQLHPLLKFLLILATIIIIGFRWNTHSFVLNVAFLCILFSVSNLKISELVSVVKPFRFLLILTFCFQYLSMGVELFSIDLDRFFSASLYTLRFGVLICFSALFTLTTSPIDIVKVLNFVLTPLRLLGVDVHRFSLSALVALRFIPVLFKESSRILDRLKSEGEIPNKGFGVIRKIDLFLNPLFDRIFHYTDRVATFMSKKNDWGAILVMEQISSRDKVLFGIGVVIIAGGLFV